MEQKNSKVTKIEFKRDWAGPNGTVYYFLIEFENGDKGQFSTKKREQDKFKEGVATDYTLETKQRGEFTDVIINKPQHQNGQAAAKKPYDPESEKLRNRMIARQNALTNATKFVVGRNAGLPADKQLTSAQVLELAEKMYEYLTIPFKDKL